MLLAQKRESQITTIKQCKNREQRLDKHITTLVGVQLRNAPLQIEVQTQVHEEEEVNSTFWLVS